MPKRIQSPSSINTFKQCPRKYYYHYILNLPTKPSIHTLRGNVVHEVLEDFFDIDISSINLTNYPHELRKHAQSVFLKKWQANRVQLRGFLPTADQEKFFFSESLLMVSNWLEQFLERVRTSQSSNFQDIFQKLIPAREQQYISPKLSVRGFIDAIEQNGDEVRIIDYKTNAYLDISEEQRLQLGIYSVLYHEKHGKLPNKVGIFFLRSKPKFISVTQELLDHTVFEINLVHEKTQSVLIDDYPLKTSGLCKMCDFYSMCFKQKSLAEFIAAQKEPQASRPQ